MSFQIKHILSSMRPKQWIKNVFIFLPLLFSLNLFQFNLLLKVFIGFLLFSITAGCIYIFNDVIDIEQDRIHPEKSKRPIAAGNLKSHIALCIAAVFITICLFISFYINNKFFVILLLYIILNLFYSYKLKRIVILDVMCISLGFVFRVLAGTYLVQVLPSNWLIICTITLSLFIGFTKRRHELILMGDNANNHRSVLNEYSVVFLDQMIAVATACTVMSYALYTIDDATIARFGTTNLIYTFPFVIYAIYRYFYLVHKKRLPVDPIYIALKDPSLIITAMVWFLSVIFIIY